MWVRESRFRYQGRDHHRIEHVFLGRIPSTAPQVVLQPTENEKAGLIERRWWSGHELRRCRDKLLPATLPDLLDDLLAGRFSRHPSRSSADRRRVGHRRHTGPAVRSCGSSSSPWIEAVHPPKCGALMVSDPGPGGACVAVPGQLSSRRSSRRVSWPSATKPRRCRASWSTAANCRPAGAVRSSNLVSSPLGSSRDRFGKIRTTSERGRQTSAGERHG